MFTTTVRFTTDQWAMIVGESDRLGIGRSTFVREAVIFYLGRRQGDDRLNRLEARVGALAERVEGLARLLGTVIKRGVGGR